MVTFMFKNQLFLQYFFYITIDVIKILHECYQIIYKMNYHLKEIKGHMSQIFLENIYCLIIISD